MALPKYTEDDPAAAGDVPEEQSTPTPGEGDQQEPQREDTMFIHPDMLGGLDPESIQAGDVLEFRVVGRDADGDIEVEYNHGDDSQGHMSGMDKVKNDFREHMSGNPETSGGY